jgi:hypothetical protein
MDKLIRSWFDKALLGVAKGLVLFLQDATKPCTRKPSLVGDSALTPNSPWLDKSFYCLNHFV